MADDYLGKKMEDYERTRGRRRPAPAHRGSMAMSSVKRDGYIKNPFAPMRVLVVDGLSPLGREMVETLRKVGMRVAFTAAEAREGNALAQSTGARYYPGDDVDGALADLTSRWGGVDMIARVADSQSPGPIQLTITR